MIANLEIKYLLVTSFTIFLTIGCATMEDRWIEAKTKDSSNSYLDFLTRYPQGELADKARLRIEQLHFRNAERTGTVEAYMEFLRRYPDGRLAKKAHARLEELEWKKAKKINIAAVYIEFLNKYPESIFANYAVQRLRALLLHEVRKIMIGKITIGKIYGSSFFDSPPGPPGTFAFALLTVVLQNGNIVPTTTVPVNSTKTNYVEKEIYDILKAELKSAGYHVVARGYDAKLDLSYKEEYMSNAWTYGANYGQPYFSLKIGLSNKDFGTFYANRIERAIPYDVFKEVRDTWFKHIKVDIQKSIRGLLPFKMQIEP